MVITTTAYSILPYAGFGSAIACAAFGQPVAATFDTLIGAVTAGPQIIQEIRKRDNNKTPVLAVCGRPGVGYIYWVMRTL